MAEFYSPLHWFIVFFILFAVDPECHSGSHIAMARAAGDREGYARGYKEGQQTSARM